MPRILDVYKRQSLVGGKLKQDEDYEVANQMASYCEFLETLGYTSQEAYQLLFMILELVSTLAYSSIVLHQPDDINAMKPMLYTTIRKMIERS